jgi:protein-tyrosine kinase
MTIQDALEKAKRQRQALQRGTAVPSLADLPRPDPAGGRPVDLKLQTVPYDPGACEVNRVLVPENADPSAGGSLAAYRMLRTRLMHKMRANRWSTLAVTSPGPGEGKSLTALNLALSIAREKNNNVFLVDLDLHNPSICRYLGVEPPHSIVRYFTGEATADDVLFRVGIEHLALAGGVEATAQSSELLASGRLDQLLEHIRRSAPNPFVVLDLPPVLSTDDYLVTAPRVDATLLVLAEGRTRRDGVERTMELLAGFPLAGVMLNHTEEQVTDYYGRRYGGHYRRADS